MNWSERYIKEAGVWKDIFRPTVHYKDPSQCRECGQDFWDAKHPSKRKWNVQTIRDNFDAWDRPTIKRSPNDDSICTNCVENSSLREGKKNRPRRYSMQSDIQPYQLLGGEEGMAGQVKMYSLDRSAVPLHKVYPDLKRWLPELIARDLSSLASSPRVNREHRNICDWKTGYCEYHKSMARDIARELIKNEGTLNLQNYPKDIQEGIKFGTHDTHWKDLLPFYKKIYKKPDALVNIYRDTPSDKINPRDFVSLSEMGGLEAKVPASHVYMHHDTSGAYLWGMYYPSPVAPIEGEPQRWRNGGPQFNENFITDSTNLQGQEFVRQYKEKS
jgi:hypothetical protein